MFLRQAFLFCFAVLCTTPLMGQLYELDNDIPVVVQGDTLRAAWLGGLHAPQFNVIDHDNDGRLDLLISDRSDGRLFTLMNAGTPGLVDYRFDPSHIAQYPTTTGRWNLLRDYDGDGRIDIFSGARDGSQIQVYRNTSVGSTLNFTLVKPKLYSTYSAPLFLYCASGDIPGIEDLDQDGDLDILSFNVGGSSVEWHKNLSVEMYGHRDSLVFDQYSRCFGHFQEDSQSCTAYIGLVPCAPGEKKNPDLTASPSSLHAGSTLLPLDLDGDGFKDLLVGDVGCTHIYGLHNAGTLQIANFDFVETGFPSQGGAVDVVNFPAMFFLDLDNDGIRDLISAPNTVEDAEDSRGVQWHHNIGTDTAPDFVSAGYGLFQDEMIELGTSSYPAFFNYDGDGRHDLLVGNLGRYDSAGGHWPRLALFRNTGTGAAPVYTLVDNNFLGLEKSSLLAQVNSIQPCAGDLDNDGDDDLLLGLSDGKLMFFRNVASPGAPANFSLITTQYQSIDVGLQSAPTLYDLDNDNDLDLVIGNHRGYLKFFENQGSATAANFVLAIDTFGQVKINDFTAQDYTNGYARPLILDIDQDGAPELLVGGLEGEVRIYDGLSLVPGAAFTLTGELGGLDFGLYAAPAAARLDASGWTFAVGNFRGGLSLVRNHGPVSAPAPVAVADALDLYPNPASTTLHLRISPGQGVGSYEIWDALGQRVGEGATRNGEASVDVSAFSPGIYFLRTRQRGRITAKSFIVAPR
jgi:hypothetical protein